MRAVTHSGSFHADDVFAFAVLRAAIPELTLERSRDQAVADAADLVFDVGGEYDPARRRYDHHMRDRPLRPDGIPYSSIGLIWRDYGREALKVLLGGLEPDEAGRERVWAEIDQGLIVAIDRADNGVGTAGPGHLSAIIEGLNPVWDGPKDYDARFLDAADLAAGILTRACRQAHAEWRAMRLVLDAAERARDPRILVLDRKLPWEPAVHGGGLDQVLYVVHPNDEVTTWYCAAVPPEPGSFGQRLPLPDAWAGLRDEAFSAAAGIPDGVFCHPSRFTCAARSRDSALLLASRAIALGQDAGATA